MPICNKSSILKFRVTKYALIVKALILLHFKRVLECGNKVTHGFYYLKLICGYHIYTLNTNIYIYFFCVTRVTLLLTGTEVPPG